MPKKYPPLTPDEVIKILRVRGFIEDRVRGSHATYQAILKGQKRSVTVDLHHAEYDDWMIKSFLTQSGMEREEFYGSTRSTARKINLRAKKFPVPLKGERE